MLHPLFFDDLEKPSVKTAFIAISALLGAGPAAAAAPVWNPKAPENRQVLPAFNATTIGGVLRGIGATYQQAGTASAPRLLVVFPNGRKATLLMSSCAGGNCKALSIQASWTKIANATERQTSAAIERFNHRYAFTKVYLSPEGHPSMQRYLTADYGFIRGDLAVNLLVFADQAERFAVEVLYPLERRR
jgi:hypothetical protein